MGPGREPVKDLNDKNKTSPRKIVFLVLNKYFKQKKSLKEILGAHIEKYGPTVLDRRFIYNIAKGTVRYQKKIDFVVSLFSDKKITGIDPKILNLLRMGIYQYLYMDRVPVYSAVDESVKLAKSSVSEASSKFVNAVLRKVTGRSDLDRYINSRIKKASRSKIDKISLDTSYPSWLVKYWSGYYGTQKTAGICTTLNRLPHFYLRFAGDKVTAGTLAKGLGLDLKDSGPVPAAFKDSIKIMGTGDIFKSDIYKKGLISIQDLSSQIAVKYFLRPKKGEKILDLCAAPGGKAIYAAELMEGTGEIVSVDISRERLRLMEDNLKRHKISIVRTVCIDASQPGFLDGEQDIPEFDKILVDAPCSAFGTISKDPDVKYNKKKEDLARLSGISYRLLLNCSHYLKEGGRIIFYTCTLSPIENQEVIEKFIRDSNGGYRLEKINIYDRLEPATKFQDEASDIRKSGFFEIMPYYFDSEAGFVCSIIKNR